MERKIIWLLVVCVTRCFSQSCYGSNVSSIQAFRFELLLDNVKNSQQQMTTELTQIKETLKNQNILIEKLLERVPDEAPTAITNNTCHEPEIGQQPIEDCAAAKHSGLQKLKCKSCQSTATVYCEMDKFGGGWLVVQQRLDGSESFRRNWQQYRNGFGNVGNTTEFWLGLELIHQITNSGGDYELAIELKDERGRYGYGRYSDFKISGEDEKYRLSYLDGYSGTIGEILNVLRGSKFSTFDQSNNDEVNTRDCVDTYFSGGGWWARGCFINNLNGAYTKNQQGYGISWYSFSFAATFSRMMIRRK